MEIDFAMWCCCAYFAVLYILVCIHTS